MQKSSIDNKPPQSFQRNKRARKTGALDEHQKNLQSMQRRINDIGCKAERKKNPNDPIAHPTYLLRTNLSAN